MRPANERYVRSASQPQHGLQQLARTRPNAWNRDLLKSMVMIHQTMQHQTPSLTRH